MRAPRRVPTPLVALPALALLAGCVSAPAGGQDEPAPDPAPHSAAEPQDAPESVPGDSIPEDCDTDPEPDKRQLRGAWLTTVRNIDWPSEPGLDADQQREELREWLDRAADLRLNAVYFHVRPTADAVYESEYESWARYLTGEQGGDPGYDPLAYAVEQAHLRGLELHAWFNPYRVGWEDPDLAGLTDDHPAERNPEWLIVHDEQGYLDPGNPDVREWVGDVVLDVVERYDIDGVHFDDYFYPYPGGGGEFADDESWEEHGGDFDDRDQWRRDNINRLIAGVHERIQDTEPWVQFGVSPFGVWRNADSDSTGSDTSALQSYDAQHADTRTWIQEGWIDNVIPQLYWERGRPDADYEVLVPWWSEEVADTDVDLYIGQAAYRVGEQGWTDDDALSRQLDFNTEHPRVGGDVYFSLASLTGPAAGAMEHLLDHHYTRPALPPQASGADQGPPAVADLSAERSGDEVHLQWSPVEQARFFAVYRVPGAEGEDDPCDLADAAHLVDLVGAEDEETQSWTGSAPDDSGARFYVTALDPYRTEGAVGPAAAVE